MLLEIFAHCFPVFEQVFAERIDQRGQFFPAAFPGCIDTFMFPEGRPILVAALPEVASDMAYTAILPITVGIVLAHVSFRARNHR